ncbi:hypothetical protein JI721_13380 [Alicyclobacillus cycloheptanicus]|uniref:Uncharacterized protein n=1 Tax=Alicyclobacillus cycloheptanicus TaxID=1457 RepID=A0ABT9XEZ2_9BACL|nr:hypothetical protein [Alicyclobacillus cycloheptanicus]MDQ0188644.1 hypothetical protein [Alicyclobacillus cycloheptanicus]WDM00680.1 hypothetical protein JI721_13380 [Alicyclobacillus cycloheptanicus]
MPRKVTFEATIAAIEIKNVEGGIVNIGQSFQRRMRRQGPVMPPDGPERPGSTRTAGMPGTDMGMPESADGAPGTPETWGPRDKRTWYG